MYRFDGSSWRLMGSFTRETLLGVWCLSSSDVFAVGSVGSILHYDGTGWYTVQYRVTNRFNCVWGHPDGDVFAGGNLCAIFHYRSDVSD